MKILLFLSFIIVIVNIAFFTIRYKNVYNNFLYLFRTPLVRDNIRVSVQCFADSCKSIYSLLLG